MLPRARPDPLGLGSSSPGTGGVVSGQGTELVQPLVRIDVTIRPLIITFPTRSCYWELHMHRSFSRIACWLVVACPLICVSAEWPQFRGPAGAGVSEETGLPAEWSTDSGVQWKAALPGYGASSPIVLGGRVYVACYSGYGLSQDDPGNPAELVREIVCYELQSGKQLWKTTFATTGAEEPYQGFQALHGFASGTPATDGQAVYAFFGRDGVVAVSLEGKRLWQTSVGTKTHGWGSATSPVLFENLVIVNASVESGQLVALDEKTGRQVWQAPGMDQSWSTPALVKTEQGAVELAVSTKNDVLGFDPKTGKQLWSCQAVEDYICPSVVAHDGSGVRDRWPHEYGDCGEGRRSR